MNRQEWLAHVEENRKILLDYVNVWHPNGSGVKQRPPMKITAPNAERERQAIAGGITTVNPARVFDQALTDRDYRTVARLLDETGYGVPESTDCWLIPGYAVAVDLLGSPVDSDSESEPVPVPAPSPAPEKVEEENPEKTEKLASELKAEPGDRCVIFYEEDGETRQWAIGASPERDNAESLAAHLKRWKPDAKFVDFRFGE